MSPVQNVTHVPVHSLLRRRLLLFVLGALRGVPAERVREDASFIGGWTQGETSPSKRFCFSL